MELTDEQGKFIEPFLPKPEVRADGRGRPWRDPRDVFNGILWILKTGARWKDLPDWFPPYQTCHRRYQEWVKSGILESALKGLAKSRWSALQSNPDMATLDFYFRLLSKVQLRVKLSFMADKQGKKALNEP